MEVIVNEDQLSLAIGKRGQNVRLATKLVGWNIDIRSEEELKREVTEQMGALIASGESVPLSAIEGVTPQQADALAEHNINDIDALASTSVDELVEILDLSLDEAETILTAAQAVVAMRVKSIPGDGEEAASATEATRVESEAGEQAVSTEPDETVEAAREENEDPTAKGYDEAVESGVPFRAEPEIPAKYSADPVALTEVEALTDDEIELQELGRDLRPDTITRTPDMGSTLAAALENLEELAASELAAEEFAEGELAKTFAPEGSDAASVESNDEEKQDASPDAAE